MKTSIDEMEDEVIFHKADKKKFKGKENRKKIKQRTSLEVQHADNGTSKTTTTTKTQKNGAEEIKRNDSRKGHQILD